MHQHSSINYQSSIKVVDKPSTTHLPIDKNIKTIINNPIPPQHSTNIIKQHQPPQSPKPNANYKSLREYSPKPSIANSIPHLPPTSGDR